MHTWNQSAGFSPIDTGYAAPRSRLNPLLFLAGANRIDGTVQAGLITDSDLFPGTVWTAASTSSWSSNRTITRIRPGRC